MAKKAPAKTKTPAQKEAANQAAKTKAQNKAIDKVYGSGASALGNALVGKYVPNGSLGRENVSTSPLQSQIGADQTLLKNTGPSAEEQGALSQMQAGLQGYTSQEYQAQREQMEKGLDSNYATASNNLAQAQARGKVYGAAASAQAANLNTALLNNKNDLEQQLMVKDIDERQNRLNQYGQYAQGVQKDTTAAEQAATGQLGKDQDALYAANVDQAKTNLGQLDAEKAAQLGIGTGAGSTVLSKAQTAAAQQIQKQGISALTSLK